MKRIVLVIIIGLVVIFAFRYQKDKNNEDQFITNCYDHIIAYMAQPQYWDHDDIPEYSTNQQQSQAEETLLNGTGFNYVEDNLNVVFKRGYQGELWLDFTDQSAHTYFQKEFQLWDSEKAYYYDIKNKHIYLEDLLDQNNTIDISSKMIKTNNSMHFNVYAEIEETFQGYTDYFANIGCPIVGIDKETFMTYKDIELSITEQEINAKDYPWFWSTWDDTLTDSTLVQKLDSISDICQIRLDKYDEATLKYLDSKNKEQEVHYYNPVFLILKSGSSVDQYKLKDPYNSSYFEHIMIYEDLISDFIIKYANEVCRAIYDGKGCVYWIDTDQHSYLEDGKTEPFFGIQKEDLDSLKIKQDTIITLYYHPDETTIGNILYNDVYSDMIYHTFDYLNEVLEHYGISTIVDEQYIKNFILYYNLDWQRMLGLR